jgi:hypothetical protein
MANLSHVLPHERMRTLLVQLEGLLPLCKLGEPVHVCMLMLRVFKVFQVELSLCTGVAPFFAASTR